MAPTLQDSMRLHQNITDRAFAVLRRRGYEVRYPTLMLRGAGDVFRRLGIPLGALGVSRVQLEMSGHLGQQNDAPLPDEGWEWGDDDEDEWVDPGPEYWEEYGPQEEDEEEPGKTPGPVAVRPERWDLQPSPARYRVAAGDTLVGLAGAYLGSGGRWREIWAMNRTEVPDPDELWVDQWLNMPDEAKAKVVAVAEKRGQPVKGETKKINWPLYGGIAALVLSGAALAYTFTTD